MNLKSKPLLSIALLIAIILFAAFYLVNNLHDFNDLRIEQPILLFPLILITIISYYVIGIVTDSLLRPFGVKLKQSEAFALAIVTGFYNLITPFRGGMGVRAVYLKKKHDFAYVNFLATLSAVYVLIFFVGSALGLLSTYILYKQTQVFSPILALVFAAIFLGMAGIMIFSPQFKEPENKWIRRFIKVINGWNLIKKNKRVIAVTVIITLIQLILGAFMLWLQFRVFGVEVGIWSCLFLSAVGNISLLIAVTPGNLGVQEAITVFSAATIGITPAESLSAALLGRAVSLVVLFILGPIFSYILLKRNSSNPNKKSEPQLIKEVNNVNDKVR